MITVCTQSPASLLAKIMRGIDAGHIRTWEYDSDGDFSHSPPQWSGKAILRPALSPGALRLKIMFYPSRPLTKEVKGVYYGRFLEMLFAHFPDEFSSAIAN
jgi:hypothetical protein